MRSDYQNDHYPDDLNENGSKGNANTPSFPCGCLVFVILTIAYFVWQATKIVH
ncbi:MAG: hypothetical protein US31_C0010G0014 [Berkelbacteria bacterium GW2011_GWA1_36_9]|uniref:Uncharacterized protein n=1 Tax=Berkelbacteria bacterium GW2011_GWA1_36_9 TaxID=1618331 RepID=A0A0G0FW91_9BACT|nr:MAG: hypothetical protein US31_C0010G0014 [Berkelbacteria bacterium GW2011_GWA1_36_9]